MIKVAIFSLAAVLLASQIAVIITLIVLCKKFKTLKEEVHKYKIKKNKASLKTLVVKDPKEKESRPDNEYVDGGKRHPSTLVKSNSKESIVYVPTPAPERRSKNYDEEDGHELNDMQKAGVDPNSSYNEAVNVNSNYTQEEDEEVYGNQVVIDMAENGAEVDQTACSTVNDPSTPCIEEININPGYTQDSEEIYGNQVAIDMAEMNAARSSSVHDAQENTWDENTDRSGTKSKKGKSQHGNKKVKSQKLKKSVENETNKDVKNEPIYENLRGKIAFTEN